MEQDRNDTDEPVAAYIIHTSLELRETCRTALADAGFLVFSAADFREIYTIEALAKSSAAIALVEHDMGDRKRSWEHVRRALPQVTVILGLVAAVGSGGTAEAALVTKNEGEVFGPMPCSEMPATISRLLSRRRARATSLDRPPQRVLDPGRGSPGSPSETGIAIGDTGHDMSCPSHDRR